MNILPRKSQLFQWLFALGLVKVELPDEGSQMCFQLAGSRIMPVIYISWLKPDNEIYQAVFDAIKARENMEVNRGDDVDIDIDILIESRLSRWEVLSKQSQSSKELRFTDWVEERLHARHPIRFMRRPRSNQVIKRDLDLPLYMGDPPCCFVVQPLLISWWKRFV